MIRLLAIFSLMILFVGCSDKNNTVIKSTKIQMEFDNVKFFVLGNESFNGVHGMLMGSVKIYNITYKTATKIHSAKPGKTKEITFWLETSINLHGKYIPSGAAVSLDSENPRSYYVRLGKGEKLEGIALKKGKSFAVRLIDGKGMIFDGEKFQ